MHPEHLDKLFTDCLNRTAVIISNGHLSMETKVTLPQLLYCD